MNRLCFIVMFNWKLRKKYCCFQYQLKYSFVFFLLSHYRILVARILQWPNNNGEYRKDWSEVSRANLLQNILIFVNLVVSYFLWSRNWPTNHPQKLLKVIFVTSFTFWFTDKFSSQSHQWTLSVHWQIWTLIFCLII